MGRQPNKLKQNPKLVQKPLSDGRASLSLEFYFGRTSTPVLDDEGNPVLYTSGAMKGKPKYKVTHQRKLEGLNLYIWIAPRTAQERQQNKNTLQLAEKIRFEREQEMLESKKGYRLEKEREGNFLKFFLDHTTNESYTVASRRSFLYSLRHLVEYLESSQRYAHFTKILPMDVVTPHMVNGYINYLRQKLIGKGPRKNYFYLKKVIVEAYEEGLMRKNPYKGIKVVYDTNVLLKEILTPNEIKRLAATRYEGEHREIQRAFIFCCFTGLRYCDVRELTFANVDADSRVMRFTQKKSEGRSAHASVVTPINDELLRLIGQPKESNAEKIFTLPHHTTMEKHLSRWVKNAGITKKITWHCARHSFAVNLLNGGADIKTVSSLLGHASIKMTEKYLHVVDQRKQMAVDSLRATGFQMD